MFAPRPREDAHRRRRTARGGMRVACWTGAIAAILASVVAVPCGAHFDVVDVSSRALAFGDAYVALATDASAAFWNPGGLATLGRYELQATLSRPYFVPDLLANALVVAGPAGAGAWGVGWHRLGNDFVAEHLWCLSYGRWVYRDNYGTLHLGGALKLAHVAVDAAEDQPDYDGATALTADLGGLYTMPAGWSVGAALRNVGEPELEFVDGGGATALEAQLDVGLAYRWRAESTLAGGWTSAGRWRDAFRLGGEIWFYDVFAVRAGVLGTEFSGGFGLKSERWQLDSSFVTHADLGLSGRISLTVPWRSLR